MALKGHDPANLNSGSISGPELMARFGFPALSQRKLNALAVPLAYVDRHQRYRFANRAFLEWSGKRQADVIGHEVRDVVGDDDTTTSITRTCKPCCAVTAPASSGSWWDPDGRPSGSASSITPIARRTTACAASSSRTPMSIT